MSLLEDYFYWYHCCYFMWNWFMKHMVDRNCAYHCLQSQNYKDCWGKLFFSLVTLSTDVNLCQEKITGCINCVNHTLWLKALLICFSPAGACMSVVILRLRKLILINIRDLILELIILYNNKAFGSLQFCKWFANTFWLHGFLFITMTMYGVKCRKTRVFIMSMTDTQSHASVCTCTWVTQAHIISSLRPLPR